MAQIDIRGLEFVWGLNYTVGSRHPANHNYERCIWQLREDTSLDFAHMLSQICWQLVVVLPSIFPCFRNFACIYLQPHLHPLQANPFGIIAIIQQQPAPTCLHTICIMGFPVQGSISKLYQLVLPPDNVLKLFLEKPSHLYCLPLAECIIVGLPHPYGKLLQEKLGLLQADCGFTLCTTEVQ